MGFKSLVWITLYPQCGTSLCVSGFSRAFMRLADTGWKKTKRKETHSCGSNFSSFCKGDLVFFLSLFSWKIRRMLPLSGSSSFGQTLLWIAHKIIFSSNDCHTCWDQNSAMRFAWFVSISISFSLCHFIVLQEINAL